MEWLTDWYLWLKAGHVISVIAWMAGIFYLPRLFVCHVESVGSPQLTGTFEIMERRLLKAIMNPAMISTWAFGLMLASLPGVVQWGSPWVWVKLIGILGMTVFHVWLAGQRKALVAGTCTVSGRGFRIMNEVPTLLMVAIVISVIVKF